MADLVRPIFPTAPAFVVSSVKLSQNPARQTELQDLLSSASSGVIAVWAALDDSCAISTICLSTTAVVLVLNDVRSQTKAWRSLLQDTVLCNPDVRLVGLDMDAIAYGLFLDAKCFTSRGIDVQSLFSPKNRDIQTVMGELLGATASGPQAAVLRLFGGNDKQADSSQSLPVARAYVLARAMSGESQHSKILSVSDERLLSTPRLSIPLLNVLAKVHRIGHRLDSMKPVIQQNDIESAQTQRNSNGEYTLRSERYNSRLRDNGHKIVIKNHDGSEASGHIRDVKGRQGILQLRNGSISANTIASIFTVGKEAPTNAEKGRQGVLLQVLQGVVDLQTNLAFRKIWMVGDMTLPQPARTLPPILTIAPGITLNQSQLLAVRTAASPLPTTSDVDVQLIQGPPGTGKTSVISAIVQALSSHSPAVPNIWLVAQSNVAVKNIAQKLAEHDFWEFVVLVSQEFHFDWHEHLYDRIQKNVLVSDTFRGGVVQAERLFAGRSVVLCTMSMLSHKRIRNEGFTRVVPIEVLIVDEASQIEIGDYLAPAHAYAKTLKRVIFVGDDKQLAPYGSDDIGAMESIFELPAHRSGAILLDTSYRIPTRICDFISRNVYSNMLKSQHSITAASACKFVDVIAGKEQAKGKSWFNEAEATTCIALTRQLILHGKTEYRIITPYDPQRALIETKLRASGMPWRDKVFCVDSFQGNEAPHIIISVVRTGYTPGFMKNARRTNVMLSRCMKGMYIVSSKTFLSRPKVAKTLVGKMAKEWGKNAWLSTTDIANSRI